MLNDLLKQVFFDFAFWYDLDLWEENYESYSIIENNEIISNICIYKAKIMYNNNTYDALSVGAVATRKDHRNKGYSKAIMNHIIDKYKDAIMYLSANENVLNFYPLFGFERIYDKQPISHININNDIIPNKLNFDDKKVWDYVYKRKNYSNKFDCLNTQCINMFHIHFGYFKDFIYDIPEMDTMIIGKQKGTTLKLTAVFSLKDINFKDLLKYLPFKDVEKIEFGFMPHWDDLEFEMTEYESDPLFVRGLQCDMGDFKFPEISFT